MHYTQASNHMLFLSELSTNVYIHKAAMNFFQKIGAGAALERLFFPLLLQRKDDAVEFMRSTQRQSFFICYLLSVFREFASRHR